MHQTVNRRNLRCCMHVDHQTNNLLAGFTSSCALGARGGRHKQQGTRHALPLPLPRIWPRARRTTTKAHHAAACAWCMHALHAAPPAPACMHTHARTNEPNGFLFLLSLLDEHARKQPASDAGTPLRPTNTHASGATTTLACA